MSDITQSTAAGDVLVDTLEEYLAAAKTGSIKDWAFVVVTDGDKPGQETSVEYAHGRQGFAVLLAGAMTAMLSRLTAHINSGDDARVK